MAFISVDPDVIRRYLPEFESYVEEDPMMAGEMTRKEVRTYDLWSLYFQHQ